MKADLGNMKLKRKFRRFLHNGKFKTFLKICIYFVLICISYIYLEPIIRMISMAFMSGNDVIDPSVEWVPKHPSFHNLKVAIDVLDIKKTLFNSIWFSSLLAIAQTVVSALTGFALSRYEFKGKRIWFVMILIAFIIPVPLLMIPRLMIFISAQNLLGFNLIGTPIPQILMSITGQGVYSTVLILIFYNFFNLIPHSLDEAAMIDGASPRQVFVEIVMKLSSTTVLVVFLFSLVWNWNETYITGTLVRSSIDLLPAKLNIFDSVFQAYANAGPATAEFRINEAYKMSATLISITPLLILYAFVQKQFIQGIENTGITGE
ncbi:carbohydrate ABC transporter permease [Anaerocolumna chitinilytica]|uniref:ABC transporter permease n=1 Tax=Anaerocolumna chitinilytica TaxID=1727145 RepID=A0A7I8DNQ5_9FIRM|nr:carbohydrate ABC transporter permease [Anaerocolumna chitinilytica]BCJ99337.1 ABC transporter permease [Anaerocolumna chitinilytica]